MGLHYILFFLLLVGLVIFTGCGEDLQEDEANTTESGDIQGRITNKETGQSIENATVDIGGNTALTDSEGRQGEKAVL